MKTLFLTLAILASATLSSAQEVFTFDAIVAPSPIVTGGRLEPRQLLIMQATLGTRATFVLSVAVTFADAKTETFTADFTRRGAPATAPEPLYGLLTVRGNSAITGVKAFLDLGPQIAPKSFTATSSARARSIAKPLPDADTFLIHAGDNFARHFAGKNPPATRLPLRELAQLVAAREAYSQFPQPTL
jgi:hypothetical protein